jgi:peptide-methionine (S)-S-oxide reductase
MKQIGIAVITIFVLMSCKDYKAEKVAEKSMLSYSSRDTITLGAGCFWCVEAIFQDIKGVDKVVSGYANGRVEKPTYKDVCTGKTGCVEVCQVVYDPKVVSLAKILEVFWQVHDPTTLNRQGADVGTQYRSGIYYHKNAQKDLAQSILKKLNADKVFDSPIVTEIVGVARFSPAEDYHQDYYNSNGEQSYCRMVIAPKVEKFKKSFAEILK